MSTQDVLSALGREYSADILAAAGTPKSAQDLSEELDVPIATCYRRVNELAEVGLLTLHDRPLNEEHRRTSVYRRTVDEVTVSFDDGPTVDTEERSVVKSKLDDVWRNL
jgi:predicted transcriptional regulator